MHPRSQPLPQYKDHLTIKTTLAAAQRWSLYQSSTVYWLFYNIFTLHHIPYSRPALTRFPALVGWHGASWYKQSPVVITLPLCIEICDESRVCCLCYNNTNPSHACKLDLFVMYNVLEPINILSYSLPRKQGVNAFGSIHPSFCPVVCGNQVQVIKMCMQLSSCTFLKNSFYFLVTVL